jgi:hypothetical protein
MARANIKNCGPTRGRQRIRKLGMGSGKRVAQMKGKRLGR